MKQLILFSTLLILLSTLIACSPPTAPAVENVILEYSVEASDSTFVVDISYRNELNEIVKLADQSLPWSLLLTIGDSFSGSAYINVTAPESEVFKYFASGNADLDVTNKLVDSGVNFSSSGVIVGDKIFSDPSSASSATVKEIETADTLKLDNDLFDLGSEPYYIYHEKSLSVDIKLNGETVDSGLSEGVRILTVLVNTPIGS